jgi:hypothetical protein
LEKGGKEKIVWFSEDADAISMEAETPTFDNGAMPRID